MAALYDQGRIAGLKGRGAVGADEGGDCGVFFGAGVH